jgi:hypothetical protein
MEISRQFRFAFVEAYRSLHHGKARTHA